MSPDELEFEREEAYEREIAECERLEDEADTDAIEWPQKITVYPVELSAPEFRK